MCSWCWGIAPHLDRLRKAYEADLGFTLVLGGLRPGGREPWDQTMKSFLRDHWTHVHKLSGQPFNFKLLEWAQFTYDTEPACRAVRVIRDLEPAMEFEFFKQIQERFYAANLDPGRNEFYQPICQDLAIPFSEFLDRFETEKYKDLVQEDFFRSHKLGISGFPSVLLRADPGTHVVTLGYSDYETMEERVQSILQVFGN